MLLRFLCLPSDNWLAKLFFFHPVYSQCPVLAWLCEGDGGVALVCDLAGKCVERVINLQQCLVAFVLVCVSLYLQSNILTFVLALSSRSESQMLGTSFCNQLPFKLSATIDSSIRGDLVKNHSNVKKQIRSNPKHPLVLVSVKEFHY